MHDNEGTNNEETDIHSTYGSIYIFIWGNGYVLHIDRKKRRSWSLKGWNIGKKRVGFTREMEKRGEIVYKNKAIDMRCAITPRSQMQGKTKRNEINNGILKNEIAN